METPWYAGVMSFIAGLVLCFLGFLFLLLFLGKMGLGEDRDRVRFDRADPPESTSIEDFE